MYIDFLFDVFKEFYSNYSIIYKSEEYSYKYLIENIEKHQFLIDSNQIKQGTVVALEGDFSPNSIALFLALIEKACIIVPLTEMSKKRFGCVGVTSRNKKLVGVITDGDLRRHMKNNILEKTAGEIMKKNPKTINKEMFVTNALEIMEKN